MSSGGSNVCGEWLEKFSNSRCMVEAIRLIVHEVPEVGEVLRDVFLVLQTLQQLEAIILTIHNLYYSILLQILKSEILILQEAMKPFIKGLTVFRTYYVKFQDCPGIATVIDLLRQRSNKYLDELADLILEAGEMERLLESGLSAGDQWVLAHSIGKAHEKLGKEYEKYVTNFIECLNPGAIEAAVSSSPILQRKLAELPKGVPTYTP